MQRRSGHRAESDDAGAAPLPAGGVFKGGAGNEHFFLFDAPAVVVYGGSGDDDIDASGAISAGGGDDWVNVGKKSSVVQGGGGSDRLNGGIGNDRLSGGKGIDILSGGHGNDRVFGGSGNDIIGGDSGTDLIWGMGGKDTIGDRDGLDTIFGGPGDDTITLEVIGNGFITEQATRLFVAIRSGRLGNASGGDAGHHRHLQPRSPTRSGAREWLTPRSQAGRLVASAAACRTCCSSS